MDVIVVGAGAAGLAAGCKLARAGLKVAIIEGRERPGGRIFTVPNGTRVPFELGAEFIHGTSNAVTELSRRACLRTVQAQDRHWRFSKAGLRPEDTLWDKLDECLGKVTRSGRDLSFAQLLRKQAPPAAEEKMLRLFVEGFDAADPRLISSQSLAKAQKEGDDSNLRIQGGYVRLVDWLWTAAKKAGAEFRFSSVVQTIVWRKGAVEVVVQTPTGRHIFRAPRAVITLPLGVLKSGAIRFVPKVTAKRKALQGLEMGNIVKVSFQFHSTFWRKKIGLANFGFIHAPELTFATWWSRRRVPVLAAWRGGPPAERLDRRTLLADGLRDLHRIFGVPEAEIKAELRAWQFHDWSADPFALGAYSYTRVGNLRAPEALSEPVEKTLIFAGEATTSGALQGTVHGAIFSGLRAAGHVLEESVDYKL